MDENGKIKTIDPRNAQQNDFIKVDKNGNVLDNFFKNFLSQTQNPTHTGFYAMASGLYYKLVDKDNKEEDLVQYRIDPQEHLQKKQEQEQKNEFKQFDTNNISNSEYQKYGITPQDIDTELKAMSYGYKSPHLVDIRFHNGNEEVSVKARLSLEEQPDGKLAFVAYPVQKEVDLEKPFQGIMLPDDVKKNLLETGNGGRIVNLEPNKGEKIPSLISIDKQTNRIEAIPTDKLKISTNFKDVELSSEQQESLKNGEKVLIEGMTSKKTIGTDNPRKFDAYVQVNAAKGGFDFTYDGLDRNRYNQDQKENQQNKVRIPKILLGVELTKEQQQKLRENGSVWVEGMQKEGVEKPFNAYVKVNHEKGKLDFWRPKKKTEENKTQVAVNSENKSNDTNKQSQQNTVQQQDKEVKKEKQEDVKTVKKHTGRKVKV